MTKIRVAVVGAGRIGLTHAISLARQVRGAQLVAATTSDARRAALIRDACDSVSIYASLDQLLAAETLDAVIIASSTSAHRENVARCAAAGLHIFCEKPLALSLADCDAAIEAAERAGRTLMVGHVRRFDAGHVEAKRFIQSGAIGRPLLFRSVSGDMDPPPPSFANLSVSGGLIVDAMYHDIYLSRWLLADEVVRVFAEGGALVDEGIGAVGDVDNAIATLRFMGGAIATLVASRTTRYGHDLRAEVIGDEGAVQIGRSQQTPMRLLDPRGVHHDMPRTTPDRLGEAFVNELQAFVDCIVDGTAAPVGGPDARATLEVALAATRSMHEGICVRLGQATS